MQWAVLDTNTWVSGFGWSGPPSKVVDAALQGRFLPVISTPLLDELSRVLEYPRLASVIEDPVALLLLVRKTCALVEPTIRLDLLPDEPDNRLLELAVEATVDFVVTGDKGVISPYREGFEVVTPAEFLGHLSETWRIDAVPRTTGGFYWRVMSESGIEETSEQAFASEDEARQAAVAELKRRRLDG